MELLQDIQTHLLSVYTSLSSMDSYLLIFLTTFAFWWFLNRSSAPPIPSSPPKEDPKPLRNFTLDQLKHFDGTTPPGLHPNGTAPDPKPVYLSLGGTVFDMSTGADFYGPGGSYECFAGQECGIALAKMSFEKLYMGNPDLSSLSFSEKDAYNEWFMKFRDMRGYPIVGKLVVKLPDSTRVLTPDYIAAHSGAPLLPTPDTAPSSAAEIPPIYVGCGNFVFDCSFGGVEFYGEGGPYFKFAGKDVSRALAKMSFEPTDINCREIGDLTEAEKKVLADWVNTFKNKKGYPVVGKTGHDFTFNGADKE